MPAAIGTLTHIGAATLRLPEEDTFVIFGGADKNGKSDTVLKFVPKANEWKIMDETLEQGRSNHVVVQVPDDMRTKVAHGHH